MWKKASSIIQKFSGITPIKSFFQYIFKRISNDFLQKSPKIDFKNGILDLQNLHLSQTKINNSFLTTSPYILHQGIIRKLKIVLPSIGQLAQKSIQIQIEGIQIIFKPNKQFQHKFNQKLKQLKQYYKFYEDEQVPERSKFQYEDNSLDFFNKIIKKILTNIKVKIQNVSTRVFMNTPSEKQMKPQYFSMLRIPLITFQRFHDQQNIKQVSDTQKYKLKIPQIASFLLREDIKNQFANQNIKKQDFPARYPPIYHPSTIMLIGCQDLKQDNNNIDVMIKIFHDQKNKLKKIKIDVEVVNIQFMMEGYQIVVLQKFLAQIEEFKKIYNSSLQKLKEQDQQLYHKINKQEKIELKQQNRNDLLFNDVFSSMVFKFEDLQRSQSKKLKKPSGYLDLMLNEQNEQTKKIKRQIQNFHRNVGQKQKNLINEQQNKQEQYKEIVRINLQLDLFNVYLLKYNPNIDSNYQRVWIQYKNKKPNTINQHIPCSYYLFKIKNANAVIQNLTHIQFKITKIKLLNIKLASQQFTKPAFKSQQQIFYSMAIDFNNHQKLQKFQLKQYQHYCCNQIVSINTKTDNYYKKNKIWIKHNFASENLKSPKQKSVLDYCISGKINISDNQYTIKLQIMKINIVFDLQIIKDLCNIIYPLHNYKNLLEKISLKQQNLEVQKTISKQINLFQSQYVGSSINYEQLQKNQKSKTRMMINLQQFKILIRQTNQNLKNDLVKEQIQKIQDKDNLRHICFCSYKGTAPCMIIKKLNLVIKQRIKLSLQSIQIGIFSINRDDPRMMQGIINLKNIDKSETKIFKQEQNRQISINIYIPRIDIKIKKNNVTKLIDFCSEQVPKITRINQYFKYLKQEMRKMQIRGTDEKKNKKKTENQKQIRYCVMVEDLHIQFLNLCLLTKQLIFNNFGSEIKLRISDVLIIDLIQKKFMLRNCQIVKQQLNPFDKMYNITKFNYDIKQILQSQLILSLINPLQIKYQDIYKTNDKIFFSKIIDLQSNITVTFQKASIDNHKTLKSNKNTKKSSHNNFFKKATSKNQQLSIINQEQTQTIIDIEIIGIKLRICQLQIFKNMKQDIQQIKAYLKRLHMEQKFLQNHKIDRKNSQQTPNRRINIKFILNRLDLDIFPRFHDQKNILANTQSYLSIKNINISFQQTQNFKELVNYINLNISLNQISYYFIHFTDNICELHPLLIYKQNLLDYGFKQFLSISFCKFQLNQSINIEKKTKNQIIVLIGDIKFECGIGSLIYLNNHIKAIKKLFIKQEQIIKQQIKKLKKQESQIIEINGSDSDEFENIDTIEQQYEKQQLIRTDQQRNLKQKNIETNLQIKNQQPLQMEFAINNFQIKNISCVLFSGHDFSFYNILSNPLSKPVIIQIDEDGQKIDQYQIIQNISYKKQTKKRFRKQDIDKYNNINIKLQLLKISAFKYKNKLNPQLVILQTKFIFQKIYITQHRPNKDIFLIFSNPDKMIFYANIEGEKIKVKSKFYKLNIGYTNNLDMFKKQLKYVQNGLKNTFFNLKQKEIEKNNQVQNQKIYELFLIIPQCLLNLNLHIKKHGIKIKVLANQQIKISQFFFHNKLSKYLQEDNKKQFINWLKSILKGNIGNILGNGFINIICKTIQSLFKLIKSIFTFPNYILNSI